MKLIDFNERMPFGLNRTEAIEEPTSRLMVLEQGWRIQQEWEIKTIVWGAVVSVRREWRDVEVEIVHE